MSFYHEKCRLTFCGAAHALLCSGSQRSESGNHVCVSAASMEVKAKSKGRALIVNSSDAWDDLNANSGNIGRGARTREDTGGGGGGGGGGSRLV